MEGRTDANRLNMTGTTHGSIEKIGGQWYVFYHRLTHKSDYSRQACAEPICILPDGSIPQVPITSCGLNGGALPAQGSYPAVIACHITNGHMPHGSNRIFDIHFPHVTHEGNTHFIAEINDGTYIGYKYFSFQGQETLSLKIRCTGNGRLLVSDGMPGTITAELPISAGAEWKEVQAPAGLSPGVHPLYLRYAGTGELSLQEICFSD